MQGAALELKAKSDGVITQAANTGEAEKNEPDLNIPAELERRQARAQAIEAARACLEEGQRQTDAQRRRSGGDERRPKDKDGNLNRGKPYQREFGIAQAQAQDNFTEPESRIMKRASGAFDRCYNAQTAADEAITPS